jgi:hypothetical protein
MEPTAAAPGVTPGNQTSEYQLTNRASWIGIVFMVLGVVVEVADALVQTLAPIAAQFPDVKWIGAVLLVAGAIVKVATTVGYARSRAAVKAAASTTAKALLLVLAFGFAVPAFAQDAAPTRRFGGCFKEGKVCLGPTLALSVSAINLTEQKVEPAFSPGLGAGVTFFQDQWYSFGMDGYLSLDAGPDQVANVSGMVKFLNGYVRVGLSRSFIGEHVTRIPIGIGVDL